MNLLDGKGTGNIFLPSGKFQNNLSKEKISKFDL